MGRCCTDFVLSLHKTFRFSWITLQVVIEGWRLRNHGVVVQVEMTSRPEERFVRCDKPDEQTEGLVATVFLQP